MILGCGCGGILEFLLFGGASLLALGWRHVLEFFGFRGGK